MNKTAAGKGTMEQNSKKIIIEAEHVCQNFVSDKGIKLNVLKDISFKLNQGEIVAILGRSGAGKSTFLRNLAGLTQPTSGSIRYRGKELTGTNPGVALVFQTFALMPWLTVQGNVELGLEARGVPRAQRAKKALAAIDSIGLDGFESAYPKELSGGMRQRVGIARALVLHPDALFMDEPFSALDVLTAENLRQEVLKLWSKEQHEIQSVLLVTHNIEEAVQMADRVLVLGSHPGRLIDEMKIDLPRPRDKHSDAFEATVDRLYALLTNQSDDKASKKLGQHGVRQTPAPYSTADIDRLRNEDEELDVSMLTKRNMSEAVAFKAEDSANRLLPNATPGGLAGLIDAILQYQGGVDLSDLASDLTFEVDDLFPLLDAGTMLGLIQVSDGHAEITDSGKAWHNTDILESKLMFSKLAMSYAPLVRTIDHALRHSKDGKIRGELVRDLLRSKLDNEQALQQFSTAITWGRYGELFDYNADADTLTLDEANA